MSQKTEQPTPNRIRKAREEGQVAHSKDFTQTVLLVALFGYMLANAAEIIRSFSEMIVMPVAALGLDYDLAVNAVATQLLYKAGELLAPFIGIVIGVGLFVEFWQTGMNFSAKAAEPSGKKLDVVANMKNIVSVRNAVETLKSVLKILVLSVILYVIVRKSLPVLMTVPRGGLAAVGISTGVLLQTLILHVALGYFVIALADLVWQKHQYIKQLMMTKEEVEKEYKDMEGDPLVKNRRKEFHRELLRSNEAEHVKHAAAVVTNPTHLAVAIRYEEEVTPLPIMLAKGEGIRAQMIKDAALRHGIPVLENVPLARALMAQADLYEYIPMELIEPVAEVLRAVAEMKDKEEFAP